MCEAHIQDAPDDIPQSDSDVVTPEQKKGKQEKPKQKTNRKQTGSKQKTNRNPTPETYEKGFRDELIYNKKASWILIKFKFT